MKAKKALRRSAGGFTGGWRAGGVQQRHLQQLGS